jgi:hypothetical protein
MEDEQGSRHDRIRYFVAWGLRLPDRCCGAHAQRALPAQAEDEGALYACLPGSSVVGLDEIDENPADVRTGSSSAGYALR